MDQGALERLATRGELIAYFGYGSLVNPNTHRTKIAGYANARLRGWQRRWTARPDVHPEPIALLTASPDATSQQWLRGLLVFDHVDHLPALDAREAGYDRRLLEGKGVVEVAGISVPERCPIYVYEGRAPARPEIEHVILQSYLDAVLQGYAQRYDEKAVGEFVSSTRAFHMPILRDRSMPRYPRHVALSDDERAVIDRATAHLTFTN